MSKAKAKHADVILPVVQGMIVGAFIAKDWLEATEKNFPGRESMPERYGFIGEEAPTAILSLYVGKRIPNKYRKRGAAAPFRYTW